MFAIDVCCTLMHLVVICETENVLPNWDLEIFKRQVLEINYQQNDYFLSVTL